MIAIIDYGAGNLKSVYKALTKLGYEAKITSSKEEINNSQAMILPGVGAFKDAMDSLRKNDLEECILENVKKGKFLLGICLGLQMLYDKSYEDGEWEGLGILKGEVVKFDAQNKVPHMGWNKLFVGENNDPVLTKNITENEYVYFVHSYYLKPEDEKEVVFWTEYGVNVPAVVRKGNVIGMQFHPEKSGETGIKLLKNFGELIK